MSARVCTEVSAAVFLLTSVQVNNGHVVHELSNGSVHAELHIPSEAGAGARDGAGAGEPTRGLELYLREERTHAD